MVLTLLWLEVRVRGNDGALPLLMLLRPSDPVPEASWLLFPLAIDAMSFVDAARRRGRPASPRCCPKEEVRSRRPAALCKS